MRFLISGGGKILSKETILAKVWGYDSDAVENHVEVVIGFFAGKSLRVSVPDVRNRVETQVGVSFDK